MMDQVYCGPPPTPQTLASAWAFDPFAIGLCMVLIAIHFRLGGPRPAVLSLGIGLLALLFLSPLCALTSALFAGRAVHHVLLIAVVAPLLAMGFSCSRPARVILPFGLIGVLQAGVLWFWHVPAIYERAIISAPLYWLMQLSLLGSGYLLWRVILDRRQPAATAVLILLSTIVQMGMLGALLVFAGTPLYAPHFGTTRAFGLSPLDDQQLAGLVMWVPAALPYLAAALYRVALSFGEIPSSRRAGVWFG
jgi:putative membrane protein